VTDAPELFALQQAANTCRVHRQALEEALSDLGQRALAAADLDRLSKDDRRLLDQFAYRYTRLQDDMGNRLMPAALLAMGEEVSSKSMLDCLDRLEQLDWLPSSDEWMELRRIRNEFTHEYPDTVAERFHRLELALASARRLLEILRRMNDRIEKLASASRKDHLIQLDSPE
jgi:hypothetical protein